MSPKKMVEDYGSADRVECHQCGTPIRRSNLSRHVALHDAQVRHRSSSAGSLASHVSTQQISLTCRSRSPSRDSVSSHTTLVLADSASHHVEAVSRDRQYGGLSFAYYLVSSAAAVAATEQHNIYDINRLCDFIAQNYPQVPAAARPYLVIGAASGAQHAAHIHFFAESHSESDNPNRRNLAHGARCLLSSWNLGLRTDFAV